MKNTRFIMLALVLAAAAGCTSSDGTLRLTWGLTQGGAAASCAVGDYVKVTSSDGTQFIDKFNCTDGGGDISLRPGTYSVLVQLFDANNALVVPGATVTAVIASNRVTDIGHVTFELGGSGTISATWQLTRNGALTTCAAVGAASVKISSTPVGSTTAIVDTFNCSDGGGTTDPLDEGSYTVAINLLDASNRSLNLYTPQGTVSVASGQNTPLPNIVFAF